MSETRLAVIWANSTHAKLILQINVLTYFCFVPSCTYETSKMLNYNVIIIKLQKQILYMLAKGVCYSLKHKHM